MTAICRWLSVAALGPIVQRASTSVPGGAALLERADEWRWPPICRGEAGDARRRFVFVLAGGVLRVAPSLGMRSRNGSPPWRRGAPCIV
jgi:hypothetical protein